ncbi:hypothetical protein HQ545_07150 [Candidatus Woesearchaeota archaeon]|nr:hypothetical protein [Candidatus Woesearchaeota archaeon]
MDSEHIDYIIHHYRIPDIEISEKGGPYRNPVIPDIEASEEGKKALEETLKNNLSIVSALDNTIKEGIKTIVNSLRITTRAVICDPLATSVISFISRATPANTTDNNTELSDTALRLKTLMQSIYDAHIPAYENKLQDMLKRNNIKSENLEDIPYNYRQALLLDYAATNYIQMKKNKSSESILDKFIRMKHKASNPLFEEVVFACNIMDDMHIKHLGKYLCEEGDLEAILAVRRKLNTPKAIDAINSAGANYLNSLIDNSHSEKLFKNIKYFFIFNHEAGLKELFDYFIRLENYHPEDIAVSIPPFADENQKLEYSQKGVCVLFNCLIEQDNFELAEDILELMHPNQRSKHEIELRWAKYATQILTKDIQYPCS